jgi:hypothetical protein
MWIFSALPFPVWFTVLDRERIKRALEAANAALEAESHSNVAAFSLGVRFPSASAAVAVVVSVCEAFVTICQERQDRATAPERRWAAENFRDALILQAHDQTPAHTITREAFTAAVRDQLGACAWWTAFQMPDIGGQLDRLRIKARWSQEQLSEAVGIGLQEVKDHLGNHVRPTLRTVEKYEMAFRKKLGDAVTLDV